MEVVGAKGCIHGIRTRICRRGGDFLIVTAEGVAPVVITLPAFIVSIVMAVSGVPSQRIFWRMAGLFFVLSLPFLACGVPLDVGPFVAFFLFLELFYLPCFDISALLSLLKKA